MYFDVIWKLLKPSDFRVPFSVLSSSIMRIIEIRLTKIAIQKKIIGKTLPICFRFSLPLISSL